MMAPDRSIPCTLCGRSLEQREDKNGKPYFVCNECGTQFFIRGTTGKERLAELLRQNKANAHGAPTRALIEQLEQVQGYIETFYDGEQIVIGDAPRSEEVVSFADWTRGVFGRAVQELKRRASGR